MISAALPTAIAVILIHAITLTALVDLFDLKYRQANKRFKLFDLLIADLRIRLSIRQSVIRQSVNYSSDDLSFLISLKISSILNT